MNVKDLTLNNRYEINFLFLYEWYEIAEKILKKPKNITWNNY